ncbi:MAG: tRNA (N(6)-L-threonylcarbamoyladenosine(37)-C(2))-methylthiotransferase MtaB [bacterium]
MPKPDQDDFLPASAAPPRAALRTLGCRLNQTETEALRRGLEAAGYRIVSWGEPAELCVLNSCTVTESADAKTRRALRGARRVNPRARLALVGCFAQTQGRWAAELGLADIVVGNGKKMALPSLLEGLAAGAGPLVVTPPISREPLTHPTLADLRGPTRAALKVQDGCDFMCTFCIIPTARGRARPRKLANLLAEAEAMAEAGVREVVLTGVNLGTFREGGAGFPELLDRLDAVKGFSRIRISSIEPTTVPAGVLERMADPAHKAVPFLHLPLQSGSDTILRAMRRRYDAAQYRRFAEEALERVPALALGTDVLVGFPGEDEAAFGETLALLKALPFAYFHVFPYSARAGTPAVRLPEAVPAAVRRNRVGQLRRLGRSKRSGFFERFEGETRSVLFERPSKQGMAQGYTDNFIRVRVPMGAHTAGPEALRNRLIPVRLRQADANAAAVDDAMEGRLDGAPGGALDGELETGP